MATVTLTEPLHDIWVVAELAHRAPTPLTLELTYGARMTADMMGFYVKVAVLGNPLPDVSEALIRAGADRVYLLANTALAESPVEVWAQALTGLFVAQSPEFILLAASPFGAQLAPRLAQRFGAGLLSRCLALRVDDFDRAFIGRRAVYGGAFHEIASTCGPAPQLATVLPDCFGPPYLDASRFGETESVEVDLQASPWPPPEPTDFTLPVPKLSRAQRIVSVGRQLGERSAARELAVALGAQLAGVREAVDAGYIDEAHVVGITGERVSPELYVALGIRGDTAHTFGIQDARCVVAVHPDPDAPIFRQADLGLVADPQAAALEIIRALG